MTKEDMSERLTTFAVRIVKMVDSIPATVSGTAIARQIVRSGTSPSANYRAACLAKSDKDFLNKLKMVEEELDETNHWIDILMRSQLVSANRLQPLYLEGRELVSIVVKSIISIKARMTAHDIEKK